MRPFSVRTLVLYGLKTRLDDSKASMWGFTKVMVSTGSVGYVPQSMILKPSSRISSTSPISR